MKRFLALTGAAIALAGVVATAGCQAKDRTGRANRDGDTVSTTQQQPPAGGGRTVDVSGVDTDLASVDSLLDESDTQLAESSAPDAD